MFALVLVDRRSVVVVVAVVVVVDGRVVVLVDGAEVAVVVEVVTCATVVVEADCASGSSDPPHAASIKARETAPTARGSDMPQPSFREYVDWTIPVA